MSTQLKQTEEQIERIKRELLRLGRMRPGSISRQYRLPKEKKRPFYQISYTWSTTIILPHDDNYFSP